jgi:RNA polymerase sigma factor (sigma-70 family)
MKIAVIPDETLWQRLRMDDNSAFSALFERYHPLLIRYGHSLTNNPERIADCVQDVFVDVWLYRHSLSETALVKAYLLASVRKRIARLYERDTIFRHTTSLETVEFSLDFSIEEQLIADEETATKVTRLNQLVNALPARQKEALYLRFHQGLSIEHIATVLGINHQSVSNLLQRAMLHLRKEWKSDWLLILWAFAEMC